MYAIYCFLVFGRICQSKKCRSRGKTDQGVHHLPGQTVQTHASLLLEEQSDQSVHYLPFQWQNYNEPSLLRLHLPRASYDLFVYDFLYVFQASWE